MPEYNAIARMLGIKYPIIQGGMVWCSGWKLASAVSNAGGLGVIGAGSMNPNLLHEHINKCKQATDKPFGVNIPLLYKYAKECMEISIKEHVSVIITSAGNPALYTSILKEEGIKVIHVVSSSLFAKKAEQAGVDAIVAEGFEAGGHNGREETTTLVLIPEVVKNVSIPVIAAGGIATGGQMLAAFALGAQGVQIGTRFIATTESSAHENFKNLIVQAKEGSTFLCLKKTVPTRLYKNALFQKITEAESKGISAEELWQMLGEGENKAQLGIFDGDIQNGMLEVGQNISLINEIKPAKEVIENIVTEFQEAKKRIE